MLVKVGPGDNEITNDIGLMADIYVPYQSLFFVWGGIIMIFALISVTLGRP